VHPVLWYWLSCTYKHGDTNTENFIKEESMKKTFFVCTTVLTICTGCGGYSPVPVNLSPDAAKVKVFRKTDPPVSCIEIKPFTATDGHGCGRMGTPGTYEGTYNTFRNMVVEMGGNAGLIMSEREPMSRPDCYENTYSMNGVAYKCPREVLDKK
jgi:hypothetical protein